ncbi:MFS transporter [Allobranchiibius sp. CTAmp26]|uniref:MFS transporter n=1 Tax=Allobranchiibius sp. CTAmp26 TaxID=2815214 RepID=UPI001AA0CEE8|nr:MFS transporter [Allobranchiibius sp. CTAmp26]MBO1756913.1 MFS transporter [Allobranchiibius sp. CTAmp26]
MRRHLGKNFWCLFSGSAVANLGSWFLIVAVPVYVYDLTGSAGATSVAVIAEAVPGVLISPIAGLVADRVNRGLLDLACHLVRGATVVAMLLVTDEGTLWLLFGLIFVENAVTQVAIPAQRSLIPAIVGRGAALEVANAWNTAAGGAVRLVGAPLGGALYALAGFQAAVLVNAATYLIAAVLTALLHLDPVGRGAAGRFAADPVSSALRRATRDIGEGAVFLFQHRILRSLLAVSATFLLANGVLNVLVVPYVVHDLGGGGPEVGLLFTALGAGYLLSAPLGAYVSRHITLRSGITAALVAVTICFAGLFNSTTLVTAVVCIGLAGIPGGTILLLIQVQIQRRTSTHLLGRTLSAFTTIESTATVAGSAVGGLLADTLGLRTTANAILPVIAIAAAIAIVGLHGTTGNATEAIS